MAMASTGTPSCSAATCINAVLMPCPSSHLPVNTVTVPDWSMRIQASSIGVFRRLPGRGGGGGAGGGAGGAAAGASCAQARAARLKLTTRAPPVRSTARRLGRDGVDLAMALSPARLRCRLGGHQLRRAADGLHDADVGPAAAQVRLQVAADVGLARVAVRSEQRLRAHDHAGDAKAALRRLLVDE